MIEGFIVVGWLMCTAYIGYRVYVLEMLTLGGELFLFKRLPCLHSSPINPPGACCRCLGDLRYGQWEECEDTSSQTGLQHQQAVLKYCVPED